MEGRERLTRLEWTEMRRTATDADFKDVGAGQTASGHADCRVEGEEANVEPGADLTRPQAWPDFMPWPSPILVGAGAAYHSGDTRALQEDLDRLADQMARRARDLMDQYQKSVGTAGRRRKNDFDPEHGVYGECRLAMLLQPEGLPSHARAAVASWSPSRLSLHDGGRVIGTAGAVVVPSVSAEAARLVVEEAKARGWTALKLQGTKEFRQMVASLAMSNGLAVRDTGRLGLGRGRRRGEVAGMPGEPGAAAPRHEASGSNGRSATSGSFETESAAPEGEMSVDLSVMSLQVTVRSGAARLADEGGSPPALPGPSDEPMSFDP